MPAEVCDLPWRAAYVCMKMRRRVYGRVPAVGIVQRTASFSPGFWNVFRFIVYPYLLWQGWEWNCWIHIRTPKWTFVRTKKELVCMCVCVNCKLSPKHSISGKKANDHFDGHSDFRADQGSAYFNNFIFHNALKSYMSYIVSLLYNLLFLFYRWHNFYFTDETPSLKTPLWFSCSGREETGD